MTVIGVDHVQLSMKTDETPAMRDFYLGILELVEVEKPQSLKAHGGFWVRAGKMHIHFGVDDRFSPQKKPHIALLVDDLDRLAEHFEQKGFSVIWDDNIPNQRRFFSQDPVGNRIELMEATSL